MNFFKIAQLERPNWVVVSIEGRIDSFVEKAFLGELRSYQEILNRRVILDLSRCESLNIRVLRELTLWSEALQDSGGELVLMGAPTGVKRYIDTFIGLNRFRQIESESELMLMDVYGGLPTPPLAPDPTL